MGILSKKSKQTSAPAKFAKPFILNGLQQTQATFNENQPRLQEMSSTAYDAFKGIAPSAFGTSPLLQGAHDASARFASGAMAGQNPSNGFYSGLLANKPTNAAMGGARAFADGAYMGQDPSQGLLSRTMDGSYLNGNQYLDDVIDASVEDANDAANAQFSMSGRYGSGAHAGVLAKNAGRIASQARMQNYEAERGRQMQAAGMASDIYGRDRAQQFAGLGLLGQLDESAQGRQMQAAGLLSQNYDADQARQMQAIGMAPQLRLAEFAGVQPALGLLNTAASVPYEGVGALTGLTRQGSAGYGTQSSNPGMFDWMNMFSQNASRAAGGM